MDQRFDAAPLSVVTEQIPTAKSNTSMQQLRAEVISIGDEMTTGQRLDTNGQWISQRLCDLGVEVAFHSTVGDDIADCVEVFRNAGTRVDVVIMTGGLGPTQDDLTREALAAVAGCELTFHEPTLTHIQSLYKSFGREMPERNKQQAYFPAGSDVIPNPEGTAPGIDFRWSAASNHATRYFCLPGVPAELFVMFNQTVGPAVQAMTGRDSVIHHHVIRTFGQGESSVEETLGDLIARGRDPRVGITASRATISLRITTDGADRASCMDKMQSTVDTIQEKLGNLIFGSGDDTLPGVLMKTLREKNKSISMIDCGLGGAAWWALHESIHLEEELAELAAPLAGSKVCAPMSASLVEIAQSARAEFGSDIGVAIGPIHPVDGNYQFEIVVTSDDFKVAESFTYAGHSDFRHLRAVKQVLNTVRLALLEDEQA